MTHSDPFQLLRQPGASVPSNDLEGLGKHASNLYLCHGMSLNDAVVKVAQEHPGITAQQVNRVVEYANRHTFQELFEKQAGDKNVEFPIADPHAVAQILNDGACPPVVKTASHEFFQDPVAPANRELEYDLALAELFGVKLASTPSMEKAANHGAPSRPQSGEDAFRELTGGMQKEASGSVLFREVTCPAPGDSASLDQGGIDKTASAYLRAGGQLSELVRKDLEKMASLEAIRSAVDTTGGYPMENPFGDLQRATWQLDKLAEEAQAAVEINEVLTKEAEAEFHHHLRQHLLDGGDLGEISHAMAGMSSPGVVKAAMQGFQPVLRKLAAEHRISLSQLQARAVRYEMEKGASYRIANPNHPIINAFAGFLKHAQVQRTLQHSYAELAGMQKKAQQLQAQAARR